MILGGLDIATTTGAAVLRNGKITTETLRCPGKKRSILDDKNKLDPDELGRAFGRLEAMIRIWAIENGVEKVAIEEPLRTDFAREKVVVDTNSDFAGKAFKKEKQAPMTLKTIFKVHGLEAVAVKVLVSMNIPCVFVNQSTWRKAFLGNGRPKDAKNEAKKQCQRLGIEFTSLDSCEAAGIVWWLDQEINPYGARRANDLFAPAG